MTALVKSVVKNAAVELGVLALGKLTGADSKNTIKAMAAVTAAKIVGKTVLDAVSNRKEPEKTSTAVAWTPQQTRQIPGKPRAGVQTPFEILTKEEYKTLNRSKDFATLVRITLFCSGVAAIALPIGLQGIVNGWYIALGAYLILSSVLNGKLQEHFLMDKLTAAPKNHEFFDPDLSVNRSNLHNGILFGISSLFTPFVWLKLTCFDTEKEKRFQQRLANN